MQTVKVRLRKPTRVFTFLSEDIPLLRDEHCIVRSDRGLEWGTCVLPPEECTEEAKSQFKMSVVRKVTHNDEGTYHQLLIDEARAKDICAQRIREHKLPMKLVDVEYTFDKHKVVFYFTSADRVDFRHLVRDLATDLKTRIELRHIQVRDEAKIIGGIGVCGRELCCSTWLQEFKPISMKMAKRQNLSLNPTKISGQCGRLLCCLSYENEMYKDAKRAEASAKSAPKEEEPIEADVFGHEGAFSDSPYKPSDWKERLLAVAEGDEDVLAEAFEDVAEGPLDDAEGDAVPNARREQRPQGPRIQAPRPQEGQPVEGGQRRSRRRRRRKSSGGGGAPQDNRPQNPQN